MYKLKTEVLDLVIVAETKHQTASLGNLKSLHAKVVFFLK